MNFKGKKVLIFGLGQYALGSGVSAARFFIHRGAKVRITDLKTERELKNNVKQLKKMSKSGASVNFILGRHRMSDIDWADIIMRNPGVPSNSLYLKKARKRGIPIYTDASLFLLLAPCPVVGVTGTRGKSTTTSLLGEMLRKKYKKVFVGGNIRRSPLTFLDKLDKKSWVVLELSSWLLESLADIKCSPRAALVTNIYPDHLNAHASMKDYVLAKENIFMFQKKGDILVLNRGNKYTRDMAKRTRPGARLFWFEPKKSVFAVKNSALAGEHNRENINAASVMARALGVKKTDILSALVRFRGLAGRQEIVRKNKGVLWVNDTTASSPEAVAAALRRFGVGGRKKIILIAGGTDKNFTGSQYRELTRVILMHCRAVALLPGTATDKLIKYMRHKSLLLNYSKSMRSAVLFSAKQARIGEIILLSPGCASFGIFKNEFDRGEQFIRYVKRV